MHLKDRAAAFYRNVAYQIETGALLPEQLPAVLTQPGRSVYALPAVLDTIQGQAREIALGEPGHGWALALVAHEASKLVEDERLQARCALGLAIGLNARGDFLSAVGLFERALTVLTGNGQDLGVSSVEREVAACEMGYGAALGYLGQYDEALHFLQQARKRWSDYSRLNVARCLREEARIRRELNQGKQAISLYQQARAVFAEHGLPIEVARCDRDMAFAYIITHPERATALLEEARRTFVGGDMTADVALCDTYWAAVDIERNRYDEVLDRLDRARAVLAVEGMDFHLALCDLNRGYACWRLNRYDEGVACCQKARRYYLDHRMLSRVAWCNVNLANTYYSLNRYEEALSLYEEARDIHAAQGQNIDVARSEENMALVHEKKGRYALALTLHQRAREIFVREGLATYVAICDENTAAVHFKTGQHERALELYRRAREVFAEGNLPVYTARCDTNMARVCIATGALEEALVLLERARGVCREEGLIVYAAASELLMGEVYADLGHVDQAEIHYRSSRETLATYKLVVDVALCDLAVGELRQCLAQHSAAAELFHRALDTLSPGFPDLAWRGEVGLGQCCQARGDLTSALVHYTQAAGYLSWTRDRLVTESLSSGFFAGRQHVYAEAIALALRLGRPRQALELVEQSKARAFVSALANRGDVRLHPRDDDDPYLAGLVERERVLQSELESLRRGLYISHEEVSEHLLRSIGQVGDDQGQREALARLAALSREYEEVVTRLRLAAPGLAALRQPPSFSLDAFREAASRLTPEWMCLEYYLGDGGLTTIYLDTENIEHWTRELNDYDRLILRQCTAPARDRRGLVYRGTLHGREPPRPAGRLYLRHLYELLIPAKVAERLSPDCLLVIVPYGPLHWLPFHALLAGDVYLIERATVLYTPALSTLQVLAEGEAAPPADNILLFGLSDFGDSAPGLEHSANEVQVLWRMFDGRGKLLSDQQATKAALHRMSESGELADYGILHFATHAYFDAVSPLQSRILLHDGDLIVPEVFDLALAAGVVTLSACESALHDVGQGDEIVGLAQAFFFAGAQTLVASLWTVEDGSTVELMRRFYGKMAEGGDAAGAMHEAQVELIGEGYSPYQWAPFTVMGRP